MPRFAEGDKVRKKDERHIIFTIYAVTHETDEPSYIIAGYDESDARLQFYPCDRMDMLYELDRTELGDLTPGDSFRLSDGCDGCETWRVLGATTEAYGYGGVRRIVVQSRVTEQIDTMRASTEVDRVTLT